MDSIELLKKLISMDTTNPPGNEAAAAHFLRDLLVPYGFQCQIQPVGENRANLIAVLGNGEGPELLLNGHLDVVPAAGDWKTPPFEGIESDGLLYGRGACDMKGGIAAMCAAAIHLAERGGPQRGRLKLLFVADEECSNLGLHRYLEHSGASDFAIIGEPTNLEVAIAHRGVSRNFIDIKGAARHAALPSDQQADAVDKTALAITAIKKTGEELKSFTHEVLPPPGIAVTMIQGYEKDNIVPGKIRLLLDFRILPGMSQQDIDEILRTGLSKNGVDDFELIPHFYMPGGEISSQEEFANLCLEERNQMMERKHGFCAFDASCEQCFLVEQGTKTVICGPGSLNQAHTVNEYIEIKQVKDAVILYESIINRILNSPK